MTVTEWGNNSQSDNNDGKGDVHDHDHDTHSARLLDHSELLKFDRVYCMFAAHSRTSLFFIGVC